jgi:septum site-determining protein MinD
MTKFVAIVSGKGGVGKTTSTLNVGQALANLGKKVLLLDANLVTPNLAIHLGFMNPEGTLNKFLAQEKSVKDITYKHESGIYIIPSSPSYSEFLKTNTEKIPKIFEHLNNTVDFVLVDSPSGLGHDVNQILKYCDESLIITNPTISSVMDSLKTIELARNHNNTIPGVVLNMTHKGRNELSHKEVEKILGYQILGNVSHHRKVRKSIHQQYPLNYVYPKSKPAKEFAKVAKFLNLEYSV